MRHFTHTRFGAVLALGALVACGDSTGPDGALRIKGILQLEGSPSLAAAGAPAHDPIRWNVSPGSGVVVPPEAIAAPDTVVLDRPFDVTAWTIGPNGCWSADGVDVERSGRVITLTPWDRHTGAGVCTQIFGYLPHATTQTLDQLGDWTLRARGRKVRGSVNVHDGIVAERTVHVRTPYTTEQPFEVVLRPGQEIVVDAVFRVLFSEVLEDSRCPVGVSCVWEGNAAVRIGLTLGTGPTHPFTLHTSQQPRSAEHGGYRVTLVKVEPVPVAGSAIDPGAYRVTLRVEAVG